MDSTIVVVPPLMARTVILDARPCKGRAVKFNQPATTRDMKGADGEFIIPTLFESQCPYCCLRISFANGLKTIKCPHCKRGTDVLEFEEFPDPFCKPGDFDAL